MQRPGVRPASSLPMMWAAPVGSTRTMLLMGYSGQALGLSQDWMADLKASGSWAASRVRLGKSQRVKVAAGSSMAWACSSQRRAEKMRTGAVRPRSSQRRPRWGQWSGTQPVRVRWRLSVEAIVPGLPARKVAAASLRGIPVPQKACGALRLSARRAGKRGSARRAGLEFGWVYCQSHWRLSVGVAMGVGGWCGGLADEVVGVVDLGVGGRGSGEEDERRRDGGGGALIELKQIPAG